MALFGTERNLGDLLKGMGCGDMPLGTMACHQPLPFLLSTPVHCDTSHFALPYTSCLDILSHPWAQKQQSQVIMD